MIRIPLPQWFTRSAKGKKPTAPSSSAELAELLPQADADVAAAEQRQAEAAAREATERTEDAVAAFEEAQAEANRLRRLRERLQGDIEAAQAREAAEARERDLTEAAKLEGSVSHAALIDDATAHAVALIDCYLRAAELYVHGRELKRAAFERATKAQQLYARHAEGDRVRHVDDRSDLFTGDLLLRNVLDSHISSFPADDPRRDYLLSVWSLHSPRRDVRRKV